VESLNQVLRFDRDLLITELLDAIWHRVMEKRSVRLQAATLALKEGCLSTPWVDKQLEIARQWAGSNSVQVSSLFEGRVAQPNGMIYLVNLATRSCSCRQFQNHGVPCGHAMALIFAVQANILDYVPPELTAERWKDVYSAPLPPINITELATTESCDPPITRVPRGRPKKERVRREDVRCPRGRRLTRDHGGLLPLGAVVATVPDVVRHRCGTCGEPGHNARRCRRPHT
jgi:hypothetical protein